MNLSSSFTEEIKSAKIFVAGHRGLVGSALVRRLTSLGAKNLVLRTSKELDLRNQADVEKFFISEKPEIVLLAAARVGGILANSTYRADFIYDNLMISANVIEACRKHKVRRLLNLGSSCIYPKLAKQPMKEEYLLTSELEFTNEPYAIAKIAALKMVENYNRQHKTHFLSAMPTNLYGPFDNFDLETSHVIPAMIRKFHQEKLNKSAHVTLWGTGEVYREFLYSDDLSEACLVILDRLKPGKVEGDFLNVGTGVDLTIRDLAGVIQKIVGFEGEIVWDSTKPNGTPKKQLDTSRMKDLGWQPKVSLEDGIAAAYKWFLENKC
jgi:GDP-L-fucose synthase